ncbi:hypothetical protein CAEBREN_13019 [Caenorhabditis brenneri]|uniref:FHA domain-containing protein n=1 Tax=Caenorhabditis brenneri TaxID=135651 RepID=G0MVF7_CAEBE|nr:hypothetical protein CAEBREN_13019 [Caenorhabditis brenneri]
MPISGVRVRNESGEEVHSLKVVGGVINFGRDKKVCNVVFDRLASRVSRVHASIEWNEGGVTFTDKSQEGTFINGKKVKQSKKSLGEGIYRLEIGGILMTVEVDGDELEETVLESSSPSPTRTNFHEVVVHESPISEAPTTTREDCQIMDDPNEFDNVTSISSFLPKTYNKLKRKSNASLFDDFEPRGKRGPLAPKKMNFDEEMSRQSTKGPRTRKADDSVLDGETPSKKIKTNNEKINSFFKERTSRNTESPSVESEGEMESIVNQVAALPSVSHKSDQDDDVVAEHSELHTDRGPAAPNETIKYANLIFHPPSFQRNQTTFIDPRAPNFKRFVPKSMRGDGRVSVASIRSNISFNTTIPMIDSRKIL